MTESIAASFMFTAGAIGLSGLWVLIAVEETHPRLKPAKAGKKN
jgi:hypothetical protein